MTHTSEVETIDERAATLARMSAEQTSIVIFLSCARSQREAAKTKESVAVSARFHTSADVYALAAQKLTENAAQDETRYASEHEELTREIERLRALVDEHEKARDALVRARFRALKTSK